MKRLWTVAAAVSLVFGADQAAAQDRGSLELRVGSAFPVQDFAGSDLSGGFGLEGTASYRFMPHLAAYGGWGWMHFPGNPDLGEADFEVEETGYALGLQFEHPLWRGFDPLLWVRAGATYAHLELESEGGELTADSGHGLGGEAGSGLVFALGERWRITPGIRYRMLSRDLTIGSSQQEANLAYVAFEMGLSRRF